jgi:hypothetical protein
MLINDKEYLFYELPDEYQWKIVNYNVSVQIIYEPWEESKRFTDLDKINWFKLINFAGTPQDKEHMDNLKQ